MSLYTCAISGQQLKEPVVSIKTGHVYERELIIKHIEATGQCPITNGEMGVEDLLPLKGNHKISLLTRNSKQDSPTSSFEQNRHSLNHQPLQVRVGFNDAGNLHTQEAPLDSQIRAFTCSLPARCSL